MESRKRIIKNAYDLAIAVRYNICLSMGNNIHGKVKISDFQHKIRDIICTSLMRIYYCNFFPKITYEIYNTFVTFYNVMKWIIKNGCIKTVKYIINTQNFRGDITDHQYNNLIQLSITSRHIEITKYMISISTINDINSIFVIDYTSINYYIIIASEIGSLDLVKYLMSFPYADPTTEYNGALQFAIINGHLNIIRYLFSLPKKYNVHQTTDFNLLIEIINDKINLDYTNKNVEILTYLISIKN